MGSLISWQWGTVADIYFYLAMYTNQAETWNNQTKAKFQDVLTVYLHLFMNYDFIGEMYIYFLSLPYLPSD